MITLNSVVAGSASQFSLLKWGQKCAELAVFNEFNEI